MSNDKEYMRKYMRERYHRRRAAAIVQLGGQCSKCGETDGLEFDHIVREGKEWTVARFLVSASEARLQKELAKCQLLCFDCHLEKTKSEPDNYPQDSHDCCGRVWTGRAYAGHRSGHKGS